MTSKFSIDVQTFVGPLLKERGFTLDKIDDGPDEGGLERHVVYYRSKDCKIQVYQSSRDGEVNCMIAPRDASNAYGPSAPKWQFFTRFQKRPDLPFKELLQKARDEYNSYSNPVEWARDMIEKNFDAARSGVLST